MKKLIFSIIALAIRTVNKGRQSGVVKCGKSNWARKDYRWENERIALRSHYFECIAGIDVS
jgi:hypothetical protein